MIGERFDENEDEICGAILNIRQRADKISIWTPNINKKKNILQIGWVEYVYEFTKVWFISYRRRGGVLFLPSAIFDKFKRLIFLQEKVERLLKLCERFESELRIARVCREEENIEE